MALPAPNLDDRRFEDLVDDALRMVLRKCPEWADHNPSDPGVTLIEAFAFITYQLIYRLNQVPDRLQLKFLDLIGLRLLPPTPARVPVTFWLSTPAVASMTLRAGTEVGTVRTEAERSVVFSTTGDLPILPCSVRSLRSHPNDAEESVRHNDLPGTSATFRAFSDPPETGDELLIGLDAAVPRCAVRLDFEGRVEGLGVDPEHPPLVWEAWTGREWTPCALGTDETGGLNRSGAIVLHLPPGHQESVLYGDRAGWVRARVVEPDDGSPCYTASPILLRLSSCTIGVTGEAVHAEVVPEERLGTSEGVPGQVFTLLSSPVLGGVGDPVIEVASETGWEQWYRVDDFAASGPTDRHFLLDSFAGEVVFGPVVRLPDGALRHYGAVVPKDATIRIRRYATGGGSRGNVSEGTIRTLKTSVPFIAAVENRHSASGGTDGETLEEAKDRGSLLLRTRNRAVTAEDYEFLGREAVPDAARIRCMSAGAGDVPAGAVKVLIVPAAAAPANRIRFADLVPTPEILARLADRLDEVRMIGTRVLVEPPRYRGVTVVVRLVARSRVKPDRVRDDALDALYRYLSPLPGGGPDGKGWPFGRAVRSGELYSVLQLVRGVEVIEDLRLFTANPVTGERGTEQQKIDLEPNSLVVSFEHQVRVEER